MRYLNMIEMLINCMLFTFSILTKLVVYFNCVILVNKWLINSTSTTNVEDELSPCLAPHQCLITIFSFAKSSTTLKSRCNFSSRSTHFGRIPILSRSSEKMSCIALSYALTKSANATNEHVLYSQLDCSMLLIENTTPAQTMLGAAIVLGVRYSSIVSVP